MVAAAYILASMYQNFPPNGQLFSVGLGFNSAVLGLFGTGPHMKGFRDIILDSIEGTLKKFPNPILQKWSDNLVYTLYYSHIVVSDHASSWRIINEKDLSGLKTYARFTDGTRFMGELATMIENMFNANKPSDAQKVVAYCEMYAKITLLKDLLLTQIVSMASIDARLTYEYVAYREDMRESTSALLEPLFNADFNSRILPAFKADVHVVTNAYATVILNLGLYDTSQDGLYCLRTSQGLQDYVWLTDDDTFQFGGKPYTTLAPHIDSRNCYWKLVPQGNNLFYIVNKKECGRSSDSHCGWMLSWIEDDNEAFANLNGNEKPLWDIAGGIWFRSVLLQFCITSATLYNCPISL